MAGELTLGVSIAVPEPHAAVITGWRRDSGDAAVDRVWPHVTLLPPTPVAAGSLADVRAHLARAAAGSTPFEMHLAGTGTFRPTSPVVYIQVARGVPDCERLEAAIRCGPLARELDFPYHPHVTVAQEVADEALDRAYDGMAGFLARFRVTEFELFARDDDGRWHGRQAFRLGGE